MKPVIHTADVVSAHEQVLEESHLEARYVDIAHGSQLHVIEHGSGPPLVIFHGTSASAVTYAPLLEHLTDVRSIVPDRPGDGLSDPVDIEYSDYRERTLKITDMILETLGIDQFALAGSSGGGVWAIWYALANPQRVKKLVLLGGTPLLPETRCPLPQRLMVTPIIGDLIDRITTSESMVADFMGMMGEKETIVKYPALITALAASNNDPVASRTARTELSACLNLLGWKSSARISAEELSTLGMKTLIIWGREDPLGGEDTAQAIGRAISNSRVEMLAAGHVPWLGYPERTARLLSDFVRGNGRSS